MGNGVDELIEQDHGDTDINSDPGDVEEAAAAAGPDKTMDDNEPSSSPEDEPEGETPEGDAEQDTDKPAEKVGDEPASDAGTEISEDGEAPVESNFRQLLREQAVELRRANDRNARLEEKLKEHGILSEEDVENINAEPEVDEGRITQLESYLETMRLSPKFEDVDTVVSQQHHDEFVDALSRSVAKEQGISYNDAHAQVMEHIWDKQTNPYRYLYENIKQYHPTYKKSEAPASPPGGKKEPDSAPPSISDVGGGVGQKGGWTMTKIDNMPEDELNDIPKEVYDKYLREELPK